MTSVLDSGRGRVARLGQQLDGDAEDHRPYERPRPHSGDDLGRRRDPKVGQRILGHASAAMTHKRAVGAKGLEPLTSSL